MAAAINSVLVGLMLLLPASVMAAPTTSVTQATTATTATAAPAWVDPVTPPVSERAATKSTAGSKPTTQPARPPVVVLKPTDTDLDGIVDEEDACPDRPEVHNGLADEDGCPDSILGRLDGRVVDADTGRPITAQVRLTDDAGLTQSREVSGRFLWYLPGGGIYVLQAQSSDHHPVEQWIRLERGIAAHVPLRMVPLPTTAPAAVSAPVAVSAPTTVTGPTNNTP